MIYLGSDHAGYELKEYIRKYLSGKGERVEDLGAKDNQPSDYPEFAKVVAQKISQNPEDKGILFCRSGQGMAMAANRFKGVRAAVVWNAGVARESRNDNNSNILSLPAGYLSKEEASKIVDVWLATPLSTEERHHKRIKEIDQ